MKQLCVCASVTLPPLWVGRSPGPRRPRLLYWWVPQATVIMSLIIVWRHSGAKPRKPRKIWDVFLWSIEIPHNFLPFLSSILPPPLKFSNSLPPFHFSGFRRFSHLERINHHFMKHFMSLLSHLVTHSSSVLKLLSAFAHPVKWKPLQERLRAL